MERLFLKTCAGTAPSRHCIGRPQLSVLIKNGRSWRKHLSMNVSRGRSSKDTSMFATPHGDGTCLSLRKAVKGSKVKRSRANEHAVVQGILLTLFGSRD